MKTAKDLELSLLLKESQLQQLKLKINKLEKALLDIKEYIEKDKASWELSTFSQREDTTRVVFTKEAQDILNIVNKALGDDKDGKN